MRRCSRRALCTAHACMCLEHMPAGKHATARSHRSNSRRPAAPPPSAAATHLHTAVAGYQRAPVSSATKVPTVPARLVGGRRAARRCSRRPSALMMSSAARWRLRTRRQAGRKESASCKCRVGGAAEHHRCALWAACYHLGGWRGLAAVAHLRCCIAVAAPRDGHRASCASRAGHQAHFAPIARGDRHAVGMSRLYRRFLRPTAAAVAVPRVGRIQIMRVRHVITVRGLNGILFRYSPEV